VESNKAVTKKTLAEITDHQLVESAQTGCRLSFEELVKRYQKRVYALLFQLAPEWRDINDLSQEAFIRVYRGIRNLRNPRTFKSWLNQIVLNLFYDELRKRPRTVRTVSIDQAIQDEYGETDFTREIRDEAPRPDEITSSNELSEEIRKAMEQLPEQFRTAIVLRELQGLQYEEIAEMLGCALGTVKSRIWRARERLQVILQPYFGGPSSPVDENDDEGGSFIAQIYA
jgi:RNA polymerase sigma-70 factor (ECF subfamily)